MFAASSFRTVVPSNIEERKERRVDTLVLQNVGSVHPPSRFDQIGQSQMSDSPLQKSILGYKPHSLFRNLTFRGIEQRCRTEELVLPRGLVRACNILMVKSRTLIKLNGQIVNTNQIKLNPYIIYLYIKLSQYIY